MNLLGLISLINSGIQYEETKCFLSRIVIANINKENMFQRIILFGYSCVMIRILFKDPHHILFLHDLFLHVEHCFCNMHILSFVDLN